MQGANKSGPQQCWKMAPGGATRTRRHKHATGRDRGWDESWPGGRLRMSGRAGNESIVDYSDHSQARLHVACSHTQVHWSAMLVCDTYISLMVYLYMF